VGKQRGGFLFLLRVEFLLKTDSGYPKDTGVDKPFLSWVSLFLSLRVEFLLKTDSGYPRDAEVT